MALSPSTQGVMNATFNIYNAVVSSQKLLVCMDNVQDVVSFEGGRQDDVRDMMIETRGKVVMAGRLTAELLGELGAKGSAWQNAKLQVVDFGCDVSPEQLCQSLQFVELPAKLEAAQEALNIDYKKQDEFWKSQMQRLNNVAGLDGMSQNIDKYEKELLQYRREREALANELVQKRLQNAQLQGELKFALCKQACLTTQIKDTKEKEKKLVELESSYDNAKDANAAGKGMCWWVDTITLGIARSGATADRKEERRREEMERFKARMPNGGTAEFEKEMAAVQGEAESLKLRDELEHSEMDQVRKRLAEYDGPDEWPDMKPPPQSPGLIPNKKAQIEAEEAKIYKKLEETNSATIEQYKSLKAAVCDLNNQNLQGNLGFTAFGTLMLHLVRGYNETVEQFAHLPPEHRRLMLSSWMSSSGEGWLSVNQELGYASKFMGPLVEVLSDHRKAADLRSIDDLISPTRQLMKQIEGDQKERLKDAPPPVQPAIAAPPVQPAPSASPVQPALAPPTQAAQPAQAFAQPAPAAAPPRYTADDHAVFDRFNF